MIRNKAKIIGLIMSVGIGVTLMGCGKEEIKVNDANPVEVVSQESKEKVNNKENKTESKPILKEIKQEKIICQILNVTDSAIEYDEVKWYFGLDLAYGEYCKDMKSQGKEKDIPKKEYFCCEYYIRNVEFKPCKLELSDKCKYYLNDYNSSNASNIKEVTFKDFKVNVDKYMVNNSSNKNEVNRGNLFWVTIEENKVVIVEKQYTP